MFEPTPATDLACVGTDVPRVEAVEKLTGSARLRRTTWSLPGMLHAKVKESPHARAKIVWHRHLEGRGAARGPGGAGRARADYKVGLYVVDKDILAKDEVRHYGEAVAAVAAETPGDRQPRRRAHRRRVRGARRRSSTRWTRWRRTPRWSTRTWASYQYVEAAFSPQPGTNIAQPDRGCARATSTQGFADADWVVEREYTNPSVQHVPMETHAAIVQWKAGRRGHDLVQRAVAVHGPQPVLHAFGLPLTKVRVIVPARRRRVRRQGGHPPGAAGRLPVAQGAGPAGEVPGDPRGGVQPAAVPQRADTTGSRPASTPTGKITAQEMTMYWDAGAYADYAVNVDPRLGLLGGRSVRHPQRLARRRTRSTRTSPSGRRTAASGTSSSSGASSATWSSWPGRSGWTRWSSGASNLLRPGDTTLTGEVITEHTGGPLECLENAARLIGYGGLDRRGAARTSGAPAGRIGKGVATLHKAPAMPSFTATAAVVRMNSDGTVVVNQSLTEIGQGIGHGARADRRGAAALPGGEGEGRRREGHRPRSVRLADGGLEGD